MGAQTVPVRVGPHNAATLAFFTIFMALLINPVLIGVSTIGFQPLFAMASFIAGAGLMLPPVLQLYHSRSAVMP